MGWRYLGGFFPGELAAPANTLLGVSARAAVVVLQIAGCLLTVFLPVMPAFGTDMTTQVAVHEQGVAVVAPGTTQITLAGSAASDELAVVKDIAERLVLRG